MHGEAVLIGPGAGGLPKQDEMDHSVLVNWVWQYFTGEGKPKKDGTTAAGVAAGDMAAPKLSGGEAISPDQALGPRQPASPNSPSSAYADEDELVDDRTGPVMLSRAPPLIGFGFQGT